MRLSDKDQQITLWLGATRYYLGRMTYAVSNFCDVLINVWSDLDEQCRFLIQRDVEEEFDRDDRARQDGESYKPLGHDIDRKQWERVRELWS